MPTAQKEKQVKGAVVINPGMYMIHPKTGKLIKVNKDYPHMFRNLRDRDMPQCGEVTNNFFG